MALRAHEVPVLVQLRPMEDVVVRDCLVWIEVEPALTASFLCTAVPGEGECLQAAIGKLNQILLQRIDAEGEFHLEIRKLAVGAVRLHEELTVLAKKARLHAEVV